MKKTKRNFPVWKTWETIEIGGRKDIDEIIGLLKRKKCEIGRWAEDIIRKPAFSLTQSKMNLDLVVVSVDELSFANGATSFNVYESAIKSGLMLCPVEVGPELQIQCRRKLMDKILQVASEPIGDFVGDSLIFEVGHSRENGYYLHAVRSSPNEFLGPGANLVFCKYV